MSIPSSSFIFVLRAILHKLKSDTYNTMFGRFQQSLFKGIGKAIPKSLTSKTTNKGLFWGLKSQSRSINVEKRIKELGFDLPPAVNPAANYVGAVRRENFIYLSGHLPYKAPNFYNEKDLIKGKVGKDVTVEQAYEAARSCALALLGTLEREVDDLDSVQIVKVTGYINCTDDFTEHSQVMNGASDLFVQVFGESRGSHTRAAVGVNSLPKGVAVEIELVAYALEEYVNNKVD